jgi:acyl-CoA thioesterase I
MNLKQMAPFFPLCSVRSAAGVAAPVRRLPEALVRALRPPRQRGRCAVLVALVLAAAACGQPDRERAAPAREAIATAAPPAPAAVAGSLPRIVFLGDSLTAGLGLAQPETVPALIQSRLNAEGYRYEVVNAGVSGDTSAGGLSRLDWSLEGMVAVLVVELGGNDGLRGLPVSQMKQNLTEIITRARQRDITVVLTGMEAPPNYGPLYTSEFRQVFRDLAKEHGVIFVPFYLEGVAGDPSLNLSDGIHPNAAGSRIIEERLWRTLEPLLEKRD